MGSKWKHEDMPNTSTKCKSTCFLVCVVPSRGRAFEQENQMAPSKVVFFWQKLTLSQNGRESEVATRQNFTYKQFEAVLQRTSELGKQISSGVVLSSPKLSIGTGTKPIKLRNQRNNQLNRLDFHFSWAKGFWKCSVKPLNRWDLVFEIVSQKGDC